MNKATNVKKQILASQIAYKRTQNNEVQLEKALAKFFNKLKKEVLNALDDYWKDYQMLQGHIDLITAPVHEAHKEYYELLTLYIKREYRLGSAEAKRLVRLANSKQRVASKSMRMPVRAIIKKDNDLFGTLPSAEERLLNRTFTASERTLSRVDSQINQIITDGYRSGKGINDVANSLNQRFDQLTTWESKRIARTEIHNSHNVAVMDTYQELGVEYTMWIAAEDERTRDSHLEINGEIIPMGGTYSNGLAYPGDTSGDIEEWINCRCSNAPFVVPYGYMAPSFSPFREDDLIKVDTKPQVTEPTPLETQETYQINGGERYSNVEISQDVLDKIIQHQENRATAKIEWGNTVDLKTGKLNLVNDVKGKKNQVTIPRPPTGNYGVLHNHPSEAPFSGGDMFNQLGFRKQGACVATTPKGVWIARDTEFGAASKVDGLSDNTRYEIKNKMDGKYRELSKETLDKKYAERMRNATTRKEYNAIKKEYLADPEYKEKYAKWLLEEYGVGVNKYNYFEIEFIPKEELRNVKF